MILLRICFMLYLMKLSVGKGYSGLPCELDVHCDGGCCLESICISCFLKRLFSTSSSSLGHSAHLSTESLETTDEPKVVTRVTATNQESASKRTRNASTRRVGTNSDGCSGFNNQCPTGCCIGGRCVDISRCKPVKAARGGKGGGRVRIRTNGGGGGEESDDTWPAWAWGILGGVLAIGIMLYIFERIMKY